MKHKCRYIAMALLPLVLTITACEKDFDINVEANTGQLIVEAYINNRLPYYNYVFLSRSQGFDVNNLDTVYVSGAKVYITEGDLTNTGYVWDQTTRKQLKETLITQIASRQIPGMYFDTTLARNASHALIGKPGKHYLLEIDVDGRHYSGTTALLTPVPVDSVTSGNHFMDKDDDNSVREKARLTVHYKDPDTVGNTQFYYWRKGMEKGKFGWGGMGTNRYTPATDDLVNGQYIHLTHDYGFYPSDTVNYFMASVERKVYNFWDSFNKARNNDGPFATPVVLQNTIEGENVIGCFSGFSLSWVRVVVK